jgi:hypothetical protein
VTSGCLVSSLAARHPLKAVEAFTSMPFILLAAWLFLKILVRKKRNPAAM